MTKAIRIKMKTNCFNSQNLEEIDCIMLEGDFNGWFKKEVIYDYIKNSNGVITVNIYPYPTLVAVTTQTERYVKSKPNAFGFDNLLQLPRE